MFNKSQSRKRRHFGFVLLSELMIYVTVGALVTAGMAYALYSQETVSQNQRVGVWLSTVAKAADAFVGDNFGILTNQYSDAQLQAAIAAGASPAWMSTISTGASARRIGTAQNQYESTCGAGNCTQVTIAELVQWGYLNQGFSTTDEQGHSVDIILRMDTSVSPPKSITGIVLEFMPYMTTDSTNNPIVDTATVADIVSGGGINGSVMGFTRRATASDVITPTAVKVGLNIGDWAFFGPSVKGAATPDYTFIQVANDITTVATGQEGRVGALFGYTTAAWSAMDRRDGTLAWTGDHDAGGFALKNASTVQVTTIAKLNEQCNNPASAVAVEKLPVGTLARMGTDTQNYSATVYNSDTNAQQANPVAQTVNSGMILACIDDGTGTAAAPHYSWQKATAGTTTLADGVAGVNNGLESDGQWMCWPHDVNGGGNTTNDHGTNPSAKAGMYYVKTVYAGGAVVMYTQVGNQWQYSGPIINGVKTGYAIGFNWTFWQGNNGTGLRWPVPVSDQNGVFYCKWPGHYYSNNSYNNTVGILGSDPQANAQPLAQPGGSGVLINNVDPIPDLDFWVYPSWKFTPTGITFTTQGWWDVKSGGATAIIPQNAFNNANNVVTATGNTSVAGENCFTDALGNQTCGANGGSTATTTTGALVSNQAIPITLTGIRTNMQNVWLWTVTRKSKCVDGVTGVFLPTCPTPY